MDLKNQSLIIRSAKAGKHNFTPIANSLIQDSNLSLAAKGLIIYILSLPENWTILKDVIRTKLGLKVTKFETIWKECKDKGYIVSHKIKNEKNQFTGWYHEVSDIQIVRHSENLTFGKAVYIENKQLTKETVQEIKEDIKKLDHIDQLKDNMSITELFNSNPDLFSKEFLLNYINNSE